MMERSRSQDGAARGERDAAQTPVPTDPEHTADALAAASEDIARDPDFAPPSKNDDLDEGETARLGDDGAGLV